MAEYRLSRANPVVGSSRAKLSLLAVQVVVLTTNDMYKVNFLKAHDGSC